MEREANILAAVRAGAATPTEIVARVYTDVHPKAHAMAERAVLAHLEKLLKQTISWPDAATVAISLTTRTRRRVEKSRRDV